MSEDGDDLIVNGTKIWPSNAGIAYLYAQIYLETLGSKILHRPLTYNRLQGGMISVGIARGALEYALAHCKEQVVGGKPLIQHSLISAIFADMATPCGLNCINRFSLDTAQIKGHFCPIHSLRAS